MKTKTLRLIIVIVLLTTYYCLLFYMAQCWYSNIPVVIERIFGSPFWMMILYSAWVLVPAHFLVVFYQAYKRKLNAGELILCLLVPIALAALFFPAKT